MLGRVLSDQYQQAAKAVTNMVVDPRGGLAIRQGTVYVGEAKNSDKPCRLIPFIVSEVEAYVLEVGEQYIRYYDNTRSQVLSGGSAYETSAPWDDAELRDLQYAQSNDELRVVHDEYFPRRLTFTSATSWALANDTNTGAPWAGNSDGHADGFPRSVAFFEQRLFYGGTIAQPNYLWGSKAADFEEFTIPGSPASDDPVEYAIAAYTRDIVQWLSPHNSLLIGTTGAEFRLLPSAYIATDNLPDVNPKSYYGSRHIQPLQVGGLSMFVQASGRQVRSYEYSASANAEVYNSIDLSFLSEHITEGGIVELAYQKYPRSIVWAVRDDGTLLSMTFDPSLSGTGFEGIGWTKHDVGGEVESVCVVPNGGADEVWIAVKRTIDGNTVRYIEYLEDGIYTDSSVTPTIPENLFEYSDDLSNAAWTKTGCTVDSGHDSGVFTTQADKIVASSSSGNHCLERNENITGDHIIGVVAKADDHDFLWIYCDDPGTGRHYNLGTGAVASSSGGSHTAAIKDLGDGWYLCTLAATMAGGSSAIHVGTSSANLTYTESGQDGLGIQVQRIVLAEGDSLEALPLTDGDTSDSADVFVALDHLEGETLDVVAGNAVHPQVTVENGWAQLGASYASATFGLRFTPSVELLDPEAGNPAGTAMGSDKTWAPLVMRLHESGLPLVNGDRAPDRSPSTPMDSMESLKTEDVEMTPPDQDGTGSVTISMDLPLPLNILAVHGTLQVGAG